MDIGILQRFTDAARQATTWLSQQVQDDGALACDKQDLAAYYKLPYLFYLSGEIEKAHRVLNYINQTFARPQGGFETKEGQRSADERLDAYFSHMDAWLAITAQRMGRFDIAYPTFQSLRAYYDPEQGAFTAGAPYGQGESVIDLHATTLMGWVSLYFGDLNKAKRAGNFIGRLLSLQPDLRATCYLRMTDEGQLITAYQTEEAVFYALSLQQDPTTQPYDIMGYTAGVLSKLFSATGEPEYLGIAKAYLEFVSGQPAIHKSACAPLAWGYAVAASVTHMPKYREQAERLAEAIVGGQHADGQWPASGPQYHLLETATENAIWLHEVAAELSTT